MNYDIWEGIAARGEWVGLWADQASDSDAGGAGLNLLARWSFNCGDAGRCSRRAGPACSRRA